MGYPKGRPRGKQSPEHVAKISAVALKRQNTPEIYALIQQYGSPLLNLLRQKYIDLDNRCNNSNHPDYKWYGGRGIENKFTSRLNFFLYIINELQITTLEQINNLQIDRINNDDSYRPGNIRFITPKVNANNRRRRNSS